MAKTVSMLEVKLTAVDYVRWEWQVCEHDSPLLSGYAGSRATAQVEGDSALFLLLRSRL